MLYILPFRRNALSNTVIQKKQFADPPEPYVCHRSITFFKAILNGVIKAVASKIDQLLGGVGRKSRTVFSTKLLAQRLSKDSAFFRSFSVFFTFLGKKRNLLSFQV